MDRAERLRGGIWGLLVGDALGVPYEFHDARDIPPAGQLEMRPPSGFRRAHEGVPPGTWSDDGAQALCLLASLLDCGELNQDDLGRRLVEWHENGYLAVDGRVFDVGIQTGKVLRRIGDGIPAAEAGASGEYDNGNGSLMRVLPLALWHTGTDAELVRDAALQSVVTHAHRRSQLCCAVYCLWARRTLEGVPHPWDAAAEALTKLCRDDSREIAEHLNLQGPPVGSGSGYVVDCLHSARLVCREKSFEAVVKAAVQLGDDTDTTAAVAGGIAGARHGMAGIPPRFLGALRGRELAEPLVEELVNSIASG